MAIRTISAKSEVHAIIAGTVDHSGSGVFIVASRAVVHTASKAGPLDKDYEPVNTLQLLRIFNLGDMARLYALQAGEAVQQQAVGKRMTSRLPLAHPPRLLLDCF
jgi:hypothetical protein